MDLSEVMRLKGGAKRACLDLLDRGYILHILSQMGFPSCWLNWIKECIYSPMFLVLTNGATYGFFHSNRGLWQGDPLSPYLFCLAMEGLTIALEKGLRSRLWNTCWIGPTQHISLFR